MEVRRLEVRDVALGCRIAAEEKGSSVGPEYMSRFLSNPYNHMIVALDGDEILGFALAYEMDRVDCDQTQMCLYEIGTRPEHRRKGVGRALMNEVLAICKSHNVLKMFLTTGVDNEAAKALYMATGGQPSDPSDMPLGFWWSEF